MGATGGLVCETAWALAKAGAEVILTGRDDRKGQSAIEKISREVSGAKIGYESLDLASLASIADFSRRTLTRSPAEAFVSPVFPAPLVELESGRKTKVMLAVWPRTRGGFTCASPKEEDRR